MPKALRHGGRGHNLVFQLQHELCGEASAIYGRLAEAHSARVAKKPRQEPSVRKFSWEEGE